MAIGPVAERHGIAVPTFEKVAAVIVISFHIAISNSRSQLKQEDPPNLSI